MSTFAPKFVPPLFWGEAANNIKNTMTAVVESIVFQSLNW